MFKVFNENYPKMTEKEFAMKYDDCVALCANSQEYDKRGDRLYTVFAIASVGEENRQKLGELSTELHKKGIIPHSLYSETYKEVMAEMGEPIKRSGLIE